MKKIIQTIIDLGIALILIKINPLDTYSYFIGLITMFIWNLSDKIFKNLGE